MSLKRKRNSVVPFYNHVKLGVALNITGDGLKNLITETSEEFHNALFENISISSRCTSCNTANLLDCPTVSICKRPCNIHNIPDRKPRLCRQNVCNVLRDRIRDNHRYYRANVYEPSWRYTDSTLWSTDAFEIIKCFLPFNGYDDAKSVGDLDFQGIVSVIINNKYFQKQLSEDVSKPDNVFSKALEILSFYNGSSGLSVSDTELDAFLEILMQLLSDSKYLKDDAGARKALSSLQQLKADVLMVSSYTIKQVLEKSLKDNDTQIYAQNKKVKKAKRDVLREALSLFHSTPRKFRSTQLGHILTADSVISAFQTLKDITGMLNAKTEIPIFPTGDKTRKRSDLSKSGSLDSLETPGTSKPIRQTSESSGIECTYKDLQSDLINLYRERHATLPLSPLIQKNKAPLLDFYVPPTIHIVEKEKGFMDYREHTSYQTVNSLSDIFMKNSSPCKNIYLTSDPGAGKTSFVKHLTLTWCQAHQPENDKHAYFKEEKDLEEMRKFNFLFFIPLSDAKRECDIHTMIQNLLVNQLESESNNISIEIAQEVLRKEKCLIILDGLDEWKHPSPSVKVCRKGSSKLPHNNIRENCTTLTTTRTWAVDTARKDKSDIDQLLEMPGLGKKSSEELISNVINHLNKLRKDGEQREINDFHNMIASKGLQKFESVPVVLMQLLCLWFDGIDPGEYQSQIYSNVLEFLFRRAEETQRLKSPAKYKYRRKLPECFAENDFCKKNAGLLYSLSELAFSTLFGENEPLYVFDQSETRKHLKNLHTCLGVGILCQTENFEKISSDKLNIFFLHKTFQEFFAALYIFSSPKHCHNMISVLNEKYKTVKQILSLETIFVFISGFSNLQMSEISKTINEVIQNDSIRRDYRINMGGIFLESYIPMSRFCDMIAKCVMESICSKSKEINRIYLEDIIVDAECADDRYSYALRQCIAVNSRDIKSLGIRVKQNIPEEKAKDVILKLGLNELESLQKLFIWGEIPRVVLQTLLEKSHQTIVCLDIWGMTLYCEDISILAKLVNVQALSILSLQMSHEMIEEIVGVIKLYTNLKQFTFNDVNCLTHSGSCPGYKIQLSEKATIAVLFLDKIYATDFVLNAEQLQLCGAEWLHQKGALKNLLKSVQKSKRLERLDCDGPASAEDRDSLVQVATSLPSLKFLRMRNLDLYAAPVNIDISSLHNIQRFNVNGVNMTGQSLKTLLLQFNSMKQSVMVCMENVTISATDNYDDIKAALFANENTVFVGTFNETAELNFKTNPKSHDRRKNSVSVEESTVWDKCIELLKQGDLSGAGMVAEKLIKRKEMPSKDQLNNLQKMRKCAFSLIQHVCKEISSIIESKCANIDCVWPSYTVEKPDEIVFVIEVKTTQTEELNIAYDHVVRTVHVFNDEGIVVRNKCDEKLSSAYSEKIQRCINRNCLRLMKRHTNLSIIDGSPVRSKGYISNRHLIQSEPCIVLYVKAKSYIPIDEEPFERQYDGFPVDVREGTFVLFMQNNETVDTKLTMGCEIASSGSSGTLGGFVEHLHHGLCGLTCAHVLLSGFHMNEVKNRGGVATWPEIKQYDSVFLRGKPTRIGRLTHVICDEGGDGRFGMEVAMFQIETDHPKSGEFYNHANIQGDERFRFDTGKACGLSRLNVGTPVYKVGATTGMTKGRIINPHLTISVQTHARRGFSVTLHNQIEVEGVGQNGEQCKFSDNGDSGALVMMKTEDGEHMCIGIVEGGTCRGGNITNTTTVVTPIVPVLERLGVTTLKSFETKELSERIQAVENRLESLEKKLDQWGSAILSRLNPPAPGNNPSSSQANV